MSAKGKGKQQWPDAIEGQKGEGVARGSESGTKRKSIGGGRRQERRANEERDGNGNGAAGRKR